MMIRCRRRRLNIVQFVSQQNFSALLLRRNFTNSRRGVVFVVGVLVVPAIIYNIFGNELQPNTYLRGVDSKPTSIDQSRLLHRIRRSSSNESVEDDVFVPRPRNPRGSRRQTIILVSSNEIANDNFGLDIGQSKIDQSPKTQGEQDENNHREPLSSTESNTDMDIIYANTLEICESRIISNQTNATVFSNSSESHEVEHGACDTERESGVSALYVFLYLFVVFFLFVGLAIVCDDFFIASLEAISEKLSLSEDVAGATFMAAGSSAPELFISVASAGTGSDIGVGTIVGSAVFNLLIIIALTACLAGKVLLLDWRPFIRDSVFYAFSIVAFILFSLDAAFKIWESLCLLLLYVLYIVIMKFNVQLMNFMATWNCCFSFESRISPEETLNSNGACRSATVANQNSLEPLAHEKSPTTNSKKMVAFTDSTTHQRANSASLSTGPATKSTKHSDSKIPPSSTNSESKLNSNFETPETTVTTKPMENTGCGTSQLITGSNELKAVKPSIASTGTAGVAIKKLQHTDTKALSTAPESKQTEPPNANPTPETSRKVGDPAKPAETQRSVDAHDRHAHKTPPFCTPKIAFQSPKKSNSTDPSPAKELRRSDPVCLCTCSTPTGRNQPLCTCCVIHISNQPCQYCSNIRSTSTAPLFRCSSCTSIVESRLVVNGPANPPVNGSGSQIVGAHKKMPTLPNVVGVKRSASLITMHSERIFSKFTNSNRSNNRESNDSCEGKAADEPQSFHEEGDIPLQNAANGEEPTVVIVPCFPPIRNPQPQKPESSDCLPTLKYLFLLIIYGLSYPWVCIFTWTIPKCDTPESRKWYLPSFLLCIGWIAFLSWVMTVMIDKIGCLLDIDSYTMGLIVVAVGTSVPDAISSILVAKEGHGDMAVSNAVGSNVFDINLGLGLPFFIRSVVTSAPVQLMTATQMCLFENLPLSLRLIPHVKFGVILLILLVIAVAVFIFVKFRLNKQVTVLFVSMYAAFMIYAFVQEKICYSFFC